MRIEGFNISMSSSHNLTEKYEQKESLRAWIGNRRPDFEGSSQPATDALIKISEKAKAPPAENPDMEMHLSMRDRIAISLIEALTGRKIKILVPKIRQPENPDMPQNNPASGRQREGWGVEYDYHESYSEKEKMSFDAEGIIKTKDNREIKFTAAISMSREFILQNNINLRLGDAKRIDPLIINFDGPAARLTNTKFSFDLDSDGKKDSISFAGGGSGFLALDINYDGAINNGSELFGPQSGNGFAELARYDSDNNKWIDESDFIYGRLKIWTKDAKGSDAFYSLKDKNIGAIYLGSASAEFGIKDPQNNLHGEAKSAGIYLKEDGSAGTIQQVDLTA
jgi:hypothetical protein